MADKLFGALSITRKAGRLTGGFDAVCQSALTGEAALVLLVADVSDRTAKRVREACEGLCEVANIPLSQNDIAAITHKPFGVLAITDTDLAALVRKALPDEEEEV